MTTAPNPGQTPSPQRAPKAGPPVVSELAGDPDMAELVELFVAEMPARLSALENAWATGKADAVSRLAHQLRGAAAGYGFPVIGRSAERLELDLKQLASAAPDPDLARVKAQFEELIDLCARVRPAA